MVLLACADPLIRYDRAFLLQFMTICIEKPDIDLGIIHLDPSTYSSIMPAKRVPGSRHRTKRGREHNESSKDQIPNLEPVAPHEVSGNRWARTFPVDGGHDVERRVRALLNNFMIEKFNPISDQIVALANMSEAGKDCQLLVYVTRVVFENTINEPTRSWMYAKLCRRIMERINPNIQDDGVRSVDGKPIAGGQLF